VTEKKNDFASWVEHVFGEAELAKALRQCRTREQMVWALDDFFAELRMSKPTGETAGQEGDGAARANTGAAGAVPANAASTDGVVAHAALLNAASVKGAPEFADPVQLQADEEFDKHKSDIVEANERISAKYEEIAKRMQSALADPLPKELEQRAEALKSRYADLMAKISEARRSGKDVLIAALVIKQFTPKLGLALATRDMKDFGIAGVILDQAEAELREAIEAQEIDVKRQVLAMAGIGDAAAGASGSKAADQARAYKP
jgi:predicted nucleic acid-binding protein